MDHNSHTNLVWSADLKECGFGFEYTSKSEVFTYVVCAFWDVYNYKSKYNYKMQHIDVLKLSASQTIRSLRIFWPPGRRPTSAHHSASATPPAPPTSPSHFPIMWMSMDFPWKVEASMEFPRQKTRCSKLPLDIHG